MNIRFSFIIYLLLDILLYNLAFAAKLELEVQNVGQGNCILVRVQQPEQDPQYMMIDIGTSSYKKEFAYTATVSPTKEEETQVPSSPSESFIGQMTPLSIVKKINPKKDPDQKAWTKESKKKEVKEEKGENTFIQSLREKLKKKGQETVETMEEEEQIPPIYIKTLIVTHPDSDHYGWIKKLFSEEEDHIDYIIFGGLPENYDASGEFGFKTWIGNRLKNNSNIYFPAIQYNPITSLEEVLPTSERTFAFHAYQKPKYSMKSFKEALNFGEDINISLLSVNPTHFEGNGNIVLRMSDPGDDNTDSLVVKIKHKESSAILTGDATGLTTIRILNNYYEHKDFLLTNVLLASHHGSFSHGSNNDAWVQATQPEFVLISNGLLHGHPYDDAYNAFKKSPRLKKVPKHKVLVAESKKDWFLHTTQRAIYSTLTSGMIKVELNENGTIKLNTEKDQDTQILTSKKKPFDQKKKVVLEETEETVLASPSPKKPKTQPRMLKEFLYTKGLFEESEEEQSDKEGSIMEGEPWESPKVTTKRKRNRSPSQEIKPHEISQKQKKRKQEKE